MGSVYHLKTWSSNGFAQWGALNHNLCLSFKISLSYLGVHDGEESLDFFRKMNQWTKMPSFTYLLKFNISKVRGAQHVPDLFLLLCVTGALSWSLTKAVWREGYLVQRNSNSCIFLGFSLSNLIRFCSVAISTLTWDLVSENHSILLPSQEIILP
jgi:hypothetical protein